MRSQHEQEPEGLLPGPSEYPIPRSIVQTKDGIVKLSPFASLIFEAMRRFQAPLTTVFDAAVEQAKESGDDPYIPDLQNGKIELDDLRLTQLPPRRENLWARLKQQEKEKLARQESQARPR